MLVRSVHGRQTVSSSTNIFVSERHCSFSYCILLHFTGKGDSVWGKKCTFIVSRWKFLSVPAPGQVTQKTSFWYCVCNKLHFTDCRDWVSLAAPTVWLFYIVLKFSLWLSYYNVINLSLVFNHNMQWYQVFFKITRPLVSRCHSYSVDILLKQYKNFNICHF